MSCALKWKRWYAWYPVWILEKRWVWRQDVEWVRWSDPVTQPKAKNFYRSCDGI